MEQNSSKAEIQFTIIGPQCVQCVYSSLGLYGPCAEMRKMPDTTTFFLSLVAM